MNQNILKIISGDNRRLISLHRGDKIIDDNSSSSRPHHYWISILDLSDETEEEKKNSSRNKSSIDLNFLNDNNNNNNSSTFVDLVLLPNSTSETLFSLILTMKSTGGSGLITFSNYLLQLSHHHQREKNTFSLVSSPPKMIPNSSNFSKWIPSSFQSFNQNSSSCFVLALSQSTTSLTSLHFVELFSPKERPPVQIDTRIRIEGNHHTQAVVHWCDKFIIFSNNNNQQQKQKNEFSIHPIQIITTTTSPKIKIFSPSSATPIGFGENDQILDLQIISSCNNNNNSYPSIAVLVSRNDDEDKKNSSSSQTLRLVLMSVSQNEDCYPVSGAGEEEMLWAESSASVILKTTSNPSDSSNIQGKIIPVAGSSSSSSQLVISFPHQESRCFFVVDLTTCTSSRQIPIIDSSDNNNISESVIAMNDNTNKKILLLAKSKDEQDILMLHANDQAATTMKRISLFQERKSSSSSLIASSPCGHFVATLSETKVELYSILVVSNKISSDEVQKNTSPQLVSRLMSQFELINKNNNDVDDQKFIFVFTTTNTNCIRILFKNRDKIYLIESLILSSSSDEGNQQQQKKNSMKIVCEVNNDFSLSYFDEINKILYVLAGNIIKILDCNSSKLEKLQVPMNNNSSRIIAFSCQRMNNSQCFILRCVNQNGVILVSMIGDDTNNNNYEQKSRISSSAPFKITFSPSCPWMFVSSETKNISLYSSSSSSSCCGANFTDNNNNIPTLSPIKTLRNLSSKYTFEFTSSNLANSVEVAVFDSSNWNNSSFVKMLSSSSNINDDEDTEKDVNESKENDEEISRVDLLDAIFAPKAFVFDASSNSFIMLSLVPNSSTPSLLFANQQQQKSMIPRKILLPKRQYEVSNLIQMLLLEFSTTTTSNTNSAKLLEKFTNFQQGLIQMREFEKEQIVAKGRQDEIPFFFVREENNNNNNTKQNSSALYLYQLWLWMMNKTSKNTKNDAEDLELFGMKQKDSDQATLGNDDEENQTEEEIRRNRNFANTTTTSTTTTSNDENKIGKLSETLQVDYFDKFLTSQKILKVCSASTTFDALDGAGKCFLAHWEQKNLKLFSSTFETDNENLESSETSTTLTSTATATSPTQKITGATQDPFCFKNDHFHPLPHSAICWAMISNSQDALIQNVIINNFISADRMLDECAQYQDEKRRIAKRCPPGDSNHIRVMGNFSADFIEREVCLTGVGLWASKPATYLRQVAEATTKKILAVCKDPRRVACWYVAQNKLSHLSVLCTNSQEPRLAAFFQRDFVGNANNRRAATDNAYAALGKGSVTLAIAFYLLARDPEQALRVMLLRGPFGEEHSWMLSVLLIRVWWSCWNNNNNNSNNYQQQQRDEREDEDEKPAIQNEAELNQMMSRVVLEHFERNLSSNHQTHQNQKPILLSTSVWIKSALYWLNGQHSSAVIDSMCGVQQQDSHHQHKNNYNSHENHKQNNSFFERLLFSEYALSHSVFLHGFCENSQSLSQLQARLSLCVNAVQQLTQEGNEEVLNSFIINNNNNNSLFATIETSLLNSILVLKNKALTSSKITTSNNNTNQVQTGVLDMSAFGNSDDDDDDDSIMMKMVSQQQQQVQQQPVPQQNNKAPPATTTTTTTISQVQTGTLDMSAFGNSDDDDDESWMLQAVNNNNQQPTTTQNNVIIPQQSTNSDQQQQQQQKQQKQILEQTEKEISFWLDYIKSLSNKNSLLDNKKKNRNPEIIERFDSLSTGTTTTATTTLSCAMDLFKSGSSTSIELGIANSLISLKNITPSANPVSELEYASCVWTGLVLDALRNKDALTLMSLLFFSSSSSSSSSVDDERKLLSKSILHVVAKNKMSLKQDWDLIWNLMEMTREQNVRKSFVSPSSTSSSSPKKPFISTTISNNSDTKPTEGLNNLLWTLLAGVAFLTIRHWSTERIIPSISASRTTLTLTVTLLKEFISLFYNDSTLSCLRWRLMPNDDAQLRKATTASGKNADEILTTKLEQELLNNMIDEEFSCLPKKSMIGTNVEKYLMILNVLAPRHLLSEFSEIRKKQQQQTSNNHQQRSEEMTNARKNSTILIPKIAFNDAQENVSEEIRSRINFLANLISSSTTSFFKMEDLINSLKLQTNDGDIIISSGNNKNNDNEENDNSEDTMTGTRTQTFSSSALPFLFLDENQIRARKESRKKESRALRVFLMQPRIASVAWQLIDLLAVTIVKQTHHQKQNDASSSSALLEPSKPGLIPRCAQNEKFVANESGALVPCLSEHSICVLNGYNNDPENSSTSSSSIGGFLMLTSAGKSSNGTSLVVALQHDTMLDGHYHRLTSKKNSSTTRISEWQLEIPLTLNNFYFNNNNNNASSSPTLHLMVLDEHSPDYFLISITTSFVVAVFRISTTTTQTQESQKPIRLYYFDDMNKIASATFGSNTNSSSSSATPSILSADPASLIFMKETSTFLISATTKIVNTNNNNNGVMKKILIEWPFDLVSTTITKTTTTTNSSALFRIITRPLLNFDFSLNSSIIPVVSFSNKKSAASLTASIVTRKVQIANSSNSCYYYALWIGAAPTFDETVSTLLPLPPHWFSTTSSNNIVDNTSKFVVVDLSPYFINNIKQNPHNLSFIGVFNSENQEMWIAVVKLIDTSAIRPTSTTIPHFCLHASWCHSQKILTSNNNRKNNNNNFGSLAVCFEYRVLVVVASKNDNELSFYSLDDLMRQVVDTVAELPPAIFQQEFIQTQSQHSAVCEKYEKISSKSQQQRSSSSYFEEESDNNHTTTIIAWWMRRKRDLTLFTTTTTTTTGESPQNILIENDKHIYEHLMSKINNNNNLYPTGEAILAGSTNSSIGGILSKVLFFTGLMKISKNENKNNTNDDDKNENTVEELKFSYSSSSSSSSSSFSSTSSSSNNLMAKEDESNNNRLSKVMNTKNHIQRVMKVLGIVGLVKPAVVGNNNKNNNGIVFASFLSLHQH